MSVKFNICRHSPASQKQLAMIDTQGTVVAATSARDLTNSLHVLNFLVIDPNPIRSFTTASFHDDLKSFSILHSLYVYDKVSNLNILPLSIKQFQNKLTRLKITHGDFGVSCKLRTFFKTFIQEEAFRHTWPGHFTSCLKSHRF